MKRDMDLIREILLWAEEQPTHMIQQNPVYRDRSTQEIRYHVYLMWQAGLVDIVDPVREDAPITHATLQGVTWHGHEFLDAIRNDTVWNRAKSELSEKGKGFTFDLLKEVAVQVISRGMQGL